MTRGRVNTAYLFIAFPMAVLVVFTLAPTVMGLVLSLFQWDGGGRPVFIGLENFRALGADHRFGPALKNTLVYAAVSVPLAVVIAFFVSVAVSAPWFRGAGVVRTLLLMPTMVSIVAIGFVWRWVLDGHAGLLNWALMAVGVAHPPDWLNEGAWPLRCVIVVAVWRQIGFCVVLYVAALAGVNGSLYEAARLDGASRWRVIRDVTWPQVAPMTVFLMVTGLISALQVFDLVYVMGGRHLGTNLTVLNYEVYDQFGKGQLGYAAAIGVVIFGVTALVTLARVLATGTKVQEGRA